MELPTYFLRRPPTDADPATIAAFEQLYAEAVERGPEIPIDYTLATPKWQFLCYLSDTQDIVLHGSNNPAIAEFEPRKSNDSQEFGNRQAVYAASDGLWPMYFAILNRRYVKALLNTCFRLVEAEGRRSDPYYFFSINTDALPYRPWQNGTIYMLPRTTFEQEPPDRYQDTVVEGTQWASLVPVRPLARLQITPEDFPFLAQIRGHDVDEINKLAAQDPEGFPWLEEPDQPLPSEHESILRKE